MSQYTDVVGATEIQDTARGEYNCASGSYTSAKDNMAHMNPEEKLEPSNTLNPATLRL